MQKTSIFFLLLTGFMSSSGTLLTSNAQDGQQAYLEATSYINKDHPAIIAATQEVISTAQTQRQKAVQIHDFVRDHIAFGWHGKFYKQKASEVLRAGVGYCNTKSTLFIAMLRAAGIPARQHFVNINARIISDFISPGTPYVDHSYTEVFLDNKWIAVDSYIIDRSLFEVAKAKLDAESKLLGYGIHRNGSSIWDGKTDAFSQFLDDGSIPNLTTTDYGVYSDVNGFYAGGKRANNLNVITGLFVRLAVGPANKKIAALRSTAP
ncbi:MAG: transglutaminase-like domain-containing protein [Bacteroidota bacterium]